MARRIAVFKRMAAVSRIDSTFSSSDHVQAGCLMDARMDLDFATPSVVTRRPQCHVRVKAGQRDPAGLWPFQSQRPVKLLQCRDAFPNDGFCALSRVGCPASWCGQLRLYGNKQPVLHCAKQNVPVLNFHVQGILMVRPVFLLPGHDFQNPQCGPADFRNRVQRLLDRVG